MQSDPPIWRVLYFWAEGDFKFQMKATAKPFYTEITEIAEDTERNAKAIGTTDEPASGRQALINTDTAKKGISSDSGAEAPFFVSADVTAWLKPCPDKSGCAASGVEALDGSRWSMSELKLQPPKRQDFIYALGRHFLTHRALAKQGDRCSRA